MGTVNRVFKILIMGALLVFVGGCMTVGYSTAKDPNMVKKFDVTIIKIEPQNIYNALGVALVGPFASVEHKGQKITFMDATGTTVSIVQPISDRYELHPTEQAVYIVDRGQVWIQPKDYPLPPEFGMTAPNPRTETKVNSTPTPSPSPIASANNQSTKTTPTPAATSSSGGDDAARLEKLKNLRDRGIITQEEYDKKRQVILDAM